MGSGDISTLPFEQIVEMCRKYSRGRAKAGKGSRDALSKVTKSATGSITRAKLGNLLENFKTDLLSTLGSQIDTLKAKKKQEEKNEALAFFFHRCKKKHPPRECPLDSIQVCGICAENHSTENFPSFLGLKSIFKGESTVTKSLYYVAPRIPWKPRTPGMPQDPTQQFPSYSNPNLYKTHGIPLFLGRHGLLSRLKTNLFNKVGEDPLMETNLPTILKHHINHINNLIFNNNLFHFNNNLILSNNNHTRNNNKIPPTQYPQLTQQPYSIPPPPQITQPQQLQLPSNQPPPRPTQFPSQPVANPNNKVERPAYNVEEGTFPTYGIVYVQDIHLRSGKTLHKEPPCSCRRKRKRKINS
jgi:hypothetical protein